MTLTTDQAVQVDKGPPPDLAPDPPAPCPPTAGRGRGLAGLRALGWAAVGLAGLGLLWQLAAAASPDLPTPAEALKELWRLVSNPFYDNGPNDKGIGRQLLISLRRVFTGFGIAAGLGIPLGLLMGASRRAWQAANPVVQLLRPVSPLAWFPIWLVMTKDPGKAAVYVICITALWPTVINTAAGAAAIPRDQRNVALVFRFGRLAYLRHVLLPNALPQIVTGLRQSMGIAWMVIVAVEMLSSGGAGIGFFVWDSYNASNLAAVIAAILLIGAVGLVLDLLFLRLGRRVTLEEVHP
ncbi:MAG: nitrate ABC transporter permease [Acidimicrobiales bacterium]